MIAIKSIVVLVIACLSFELAAADTDKVFCYHGSWSYYRTGNGRFTVNDINSTLCTHLIYTFFGVVENGSIVILDDWLENGLNNINNFNALKKNNTNLKTLFAVGGWTQGSLNFSALASTKASRQVFVQSALDIALKYGFDGMDMDWEYPVQRGGTKHDKGNFSKLLRDIRQVWDKHGLILTAALGAGIETINTSYVVESVCRYLNYVNIMTYDYHSAADNVTGENAPLYAASTDKDQEYNINGSIATLLSRDCVRSKMVLGLPLYGKTYTLSSSNTGLGAPVSGPGTAGKYTQEAGVLGYLEICELLKEGGWTQVWNEEQQVPHMYKGDQWISYDNPRSLANKVNYAKELGFAGVMVWAIDFEDHTGICGDVYPLMNTINQGLAVRQ